VLQQSWEQLLTSNPPNQPLCAIPYTPAVTLLIVQHAPATAHITMCTASIPSITGMPCSEHDEHSLSRSLQLKSRASLQTSAVESLPHGIPACACIQCKAPMKWCQCAHPGIGSSTMPLTKHNVVDSAKMRSTQTVMQQKNGPSQCLDLHNSAATGLTHSAAVLTNLACCVLIDCCCVCLCAVANVVNTLQQTGKHNTYRRRNCGSPATIML
jgi:hypothetical protein